MTVRYSAPTAGVLTVVLGFQQTRQYMSEMEVQPDILVFETGEGGNGSEIHHEERSDLQGERPGRGSVHYVAFRVDNEEEWRKWVKKIDDVGYPNSDS
ncbi:hypothetical protein ASG99_18420 [Bacillus sp. Soil768D1]|nr:hypothetical protein ASG99_18420 [Bacillus sp. Soil768D1]